MSTAVALLNKLPMAFRPNVAGEIECVVQFNLSTPMHALIKNGVCTVHPGSAATADVTLTMEDEDLISLLRGDLNGLTALMTDRLQLEGDLLLAQRLFDFFDPNKLV
ncbi:MAG: SCP2 sterol-binding domain-containing protein [Nevskiales bacterium]|nr:SCP2 sterol-binding domain-containing protein [Nevskiales bacterium]